MKHIIFFSLLFISLTLSAQKLETFSLKNGETITGEVLDDDNGSLVVKTREGKTVSLNKSDISKTESADLGSIRKNTLAPYFNLDANLNIFYTEVVTVDPSLTRDKLFDNAKKWFAETFVSGKDVIQSEDKASGLIIGKGAISASHTYNAKNGRVWFLLKIDLKDGKYKYTLYSLTYSFDIEKTLEQIKANCSAPDEIRQPLEEWAMSSKRYIDCFLFKEREPNVVPFYKHVSTAINSTIASLKTAMAAKSEDW